jgi:hypothetical protein
LPEDTSIGAVPLQAAEQSRLANRDTSRTSPVTVAAMTGPTPDTLVTVLPQARIAAAGFFLVSRSRASRRRRPAVSPAASPARACCTAPPGPARSRIRAA